MGRRRLPPTCLRLSLREPASPWCWPEPWGSLQEGREASPGGPHGNRAYGVRGGGAASRPGVYGDARGCVLLCLVRFVCVPRPLLVACDVNTVVRSSEVGRRRPPSTCSERPVLAWGRGVRPVNSQSPGSSCVRDELPHLPNPGPCTLVVACPRPGPFCSPPASGLRALSVAGMGGLSQLPIEVAVCFPGG